MTWIVLLWLAAGATMSVLVAWVAVCLPQGPVRPPQRIDVTDLRFPMRLSPRCPERGSGVMFVHPGYEDIFLGANVPGNPILHPPDFNLLQVRAGWPLRSMGHWQWVSHDVETATDVQSRGEWNVILPLIGYKGLPVIPLWPGFLANTLIYAFAGFAGVWMVRRLRAKQRIEKNECPGCGYSMEGLKKGASCPECGCFWFTKEDLYGR